MANGKTALVLSAGGMFGAYQAGVWAELCDVFDPDIVVGASVGSLNGWMIASGCSGEDLIGRWRELGPQPIRWRLPRGPLDGCIDSTDLECTIREMCSNWRPRREYGVVLTHLRTMRPTLFRWPEAQWQHVLGSCSVPGFLRQFRLEGRVFSDGGLVDPLPLNAALEMGAKSIVTVNLLNHRPWIVRQVVRALAAYSGYAGQAAPAVVDISPAGPIGSARESMHWSHANTEAWIEQGRKDAREQKQTVVELVLQHRRQNWRPSQCPNIAYTE